MDDKTLLRHCRDLAEKVDEVYRTTGTDREKKAVGELSLQLRGVYDYGVDDGERRRRADLAEGADDLEETEREEHCRELAAALCDEYFPSTPRPQEERLSGISKHMEAMYRCGLRVGHKKPEFKTPNPQQTA